MKITSVDVGCVAASGRERRVVTVRAKVGPAQESLRITVIVPDEGDDTSARELGVARAKDIARQFGTLSETASTRIRRTEHPVMKREADEDWR